MAMDRQDYPAMLPSLQPGQAVDVFNDRVRQVSQMNLAIADWLAERRRLEESYSSGLRALARKNLQGVDIGSSVFSVPWDALKNAADQTADSHSQLASKIEIDVEQPLRSFQSSNREMTAVTTQQGNLGAMAKDVDRAQQKTEKLQGKGADTSRVANASNDLDTATQQWESQAPYIFESLQALDETRLNHLRDVLTQFQTHETDLVEKLRGNAEQCLNILLNVETADEIKTFVLRTVSGTGNSSGSQSRRMDAARASTSRPALAAPAQSFASADSFGTPTTEKKSRFSAIKRMGTVSGKRSSRIPPGAENVGRQIDAQQDKDKTRGIFSRRKKPVGLEPPQEERERRPSSPSRLGSSIFRRSSSQQEIAPVSSRPQVAQQVNGASSSAVERTPISANPPVLSIPNGSHQGDLADLEPPKPQEPEITAAPPMASEPSIDRQVFTPPPRTDSQGFSVPSSSADAITQAQQEAAIGADGSAPQYNVNIRDKPIQEEGNADADAALAAMATKLQTQAPPPRRAMGTVRGRREARNSTFMPHEPAQAPTAEPSAGQALGSSPMSTPQSMPASTQVFPEPAAPLAASAFPDPAAPSAASTFPDPTPAPASSFPEPPPVSMSKDLPPVQSPGSIGSSSGFDSTAIPVAAGGLAASTFSQFAPMEQSLPSAFQKLATPSGTDNQSIRSGKSLSSTTSQSHKHPELNEQGLSSSIVESISARFEGNKLIASSLIGEIAMAYHPAELSGPIGSDTIRLENFSSLEKVAPNPAFISQVSEKEGEYSVNLSTLSKAQVAFKYQVSSEGSVTQVPLEMAPAFKIEPTQASVIISFALNPGFSAGGRDSITLSNLLLALTLEGAKATSCQSKPVGTFSRERNLIYWQLNDITLTAGAGPTRLLARFATESEAKSGTVEARWEVTGEQAQGIGSGLSVSVQSAGADPFADDDGAWKPINTVKKIASASGAYVAKG